MLSARRRALYRVTHPAAFSLLTIHFHYSLFTVHSLSLFTIHYSIHYSIDDSIDYSIDYSLACRDDCATKAVRQDDREQKVRVVSRRGVGVLTLRLA